MNYNLNFENDRVVAYCSICGAVIGIWDNDYVSNYPNGFNVAVEQEWLHHSKNHEEFDHVVHCANGCGAVIGIWDNDYVSNYPNGFDCAVEQEQHNHNRHCPVLWDEWRKKNNALEGETPRALIRRYIREGENPFDITIPPDREFVWVGYSDWWEEIFLISTLKIKIFGLKIGFNFLKKKFLDRFYWERLKCYNYNFFDKKFYFGY